MTCLMAAGRPGHCHLLVLVPADGGQSPQAGFCRPWRDLTGFWTANPPLKRWAIIGRPTGTGEEGRRQGREAQSRNVMNSDGVGVGLDDLSSSPKAVTCPRTPKSPIANRQSPVADGWVYSSGRRRCRCRGTEEISPDGKRQVRPHPDPLPEEREIRRPSPG